jgi:hypothetical protein
MINYDRMNALDAKRKIRKLQHLRHFNWLPMNSTPRSGESEEIAFHFPDRESSELKGAWNA